MTDRAERLDAQFECGCWFRQVGVQRYPAITGVMCCPIHRKPYKAERQVGERLSEQEDMLNDIHAWLRSQFRSEGLGEVSRRYFAWLLEEVDAQARQLAEAARKVDAYDAARATVKREGNTRAYYVLRAEEAERQLAEAERENGRLREQRKEDTEDALRYLDALDRIDAGWAPPPRGSGQLHWTQEIARAAIHPPDPPASPAEGSEA